MKWRGYSTLACLAIHGIVFVTLVRPMLSADGCHALGYVIPALIAEFPGSLLAFGLAALTQSTTVFVYSCLCFGAVSYGLLGYFIGMVIEKQSNKGPS